MSNTSLSQTEKNAQIVMVKILLDEKLDKISAEFMAMCSENDGEEIFQMLENMVEQGKSTFEDFVSERRRRVSYPVFIEGNESFNNSVLESHQKYLLGEIMASMVKLETESTKLSSIWWFAAWVDKQATWLLLEEVAIRIKVLRLEWQLKQIKEKKQASTKKITGSDIHRHTTDYIPKVDYPKWLRSVYVDYYRGKQNQLKRKITVPEDLFISEAAMDKGIKALRMIRPENPIIDENRYWNGRRGTVRILAAWVYWLRSHHMILNVGPVKSIIPLLEQLFPGLILGTDARTFKSDFPEIVEQFNKLDLT